MRQKQPLIIIRVSNPSAFSGRGSIIILEYTDEDEAMRTAQMIALETGRGVTVQDEDARVLGAIPSATTH